MRRSPTGARRSLRARDWLDARGIALRLHGRARQARDLRGRDADDDREGRRPVADRSAVHRRCRIPGIAVDLRPALFDGKARERLYQQTDTHWNDRGALLAYQQIIDAVRARVPATPPAWTRDDFESAERDIEGLDLAGMMGLTRVLRETDLMLIPKRPRRARVARTGRRRADRRGGPNRDGDR